MSRYLLIGAGFSRNWNGWLADEIAGDLAGRITADADLSRILKQADDFESALTQLQDEHRLRQSTETLTRLDRFERAIVATFDAMNEEFRRRPTWEFCNDLEFSISKFLAKFDAIFSLNQDLLLEQHYFPAMVIAGYPKWSGIHLPGIKPRPDGTSHTNHASLTWQPDSQFQLPANMQPIFKLHGSMNWRDSNGGRLLVMGGNKASVVWQSSVLKRYADEFERCLSTGGARLMVIGYGFRDPHINDIIGRAWQRSQAPLFLVGPDGRAAINKANPTFEKPIYCPELLDEVGIVGESTRLLSSAFGGSDFAEHGKLMRFFAG